MPARPKTLLLGALGLSLLASWLTRYVNDYVLNILINVGINITLAVSLNLINGYTGQFSMGHAGFMAVGGYTAAWLTLNVGPMLLGGSAHPLARALVFAGALFAGGLAAAGAGLVVGIPSLRLRGDYLALVTLGFGEIIRVIIQNLEAVGAASGLKGIPPYTTFFATCVVACITTYVVVCLVNSTYGRGFIAVHDDEVAAAAMGINPTKFKVVAFVIGAFFAGVAGGLFGHYTTFLSPTGFDFIRSIEIVVIVILGGMGNTPGVIVAAILLTVLNEQLRKVGEFRMIIYSLLLIALMLARPQGLFTWRRGSARV
jgi:branched-chain amino acid transport system permease protein